MLFWFVRRRLLLFHLNQHKTLQTGGQGTLAWQAGGVLKLHCVSSFSVDVACVWMCFWFSCFMMYGTLICHVFRAKRKIFLKSWISKAKIKSHQRVSFFLLPPHGRWTSTTADNMSSFVTLSLGQWRNELKRISNLMHETPKVRSSSTVWDVGCLEDTAVHWA